MRLIRATISNYRIHQRLEIEFQSGVTIVAGLNESGKSTLIEALHRCLFLSHRAGGEALKSMRSLHGGHPRVELTFQAEGSEWRLSKTFSGSGGTALLVRESPSGRWDSDAAEEKLAELTGRAVVSARSAQDLQRSWEHLWVRQGSALEDPLTQIEPRDLEAALASRPEAGDHLLLGSSSDSVVQILEAAVEAEWKKNHTELRIDGEAGRLENDLRKVDSELGLLISARDGRESRANQLGTARRLRDEAANAASHSEQESNTLAALMDELTGADEALVRAENEIEAHAKEIAAFERLDARLREESEKLANAMAELQTHEEQESQAREQLRESSTLQESATERRAELDNRRIEAEQRLELAIVRRDIAREESRLTQLRTELDSWRAHKKDMREAEDTLTRMPSVDETRITALEGTEDDLRTVQARIEGSAARVQLLAGGTPMLLDGKPLEPEGLELVAKPALLRHQDGTCVRILPGGKDLAALIDELESIESKRRQLQLELGVDSSAQARQLQTQREKQEALLAQLTKQSRQRADPGPELETVEARLKALELRSHSLKQDGVHHATGDDPEMLEREVAILREGTGKLDEQLSKLRNQARILQGNAERRREARAQAEAEKAKLEGSLLQLSSQLGDDSGRRSTKEAQMLRAKELQENRQASEEKSKRLSDLRERRGRVIDALGKQRSTRDNAAGEITALERELLGDVQQDHGARIEEVRARQTRLKARAEAARGRADADLLLKQQFDEVRKDARDTRLAPFKKACSEYLSVAYGAPISINFDDTEGATTTGSINRRAAGLDEHSFAVLSHGAREFTGLAVRLAMAEVLAAEQKDGCLPVVLDDAAANIDPERFRQVGFLLALAASRGLQVVFATCNVDEASRLQGDGVVILQRPRFIAGSTPTARPNHEADEDHEPSSLAGTEESSNDDPELALKALQNEGGTASSRAWRAALGWDEERFNAARELLARHGEVGQLDGTRTWQVRGR